MTPTAQRIYELMPAIYRIRDEQQGGHLKELINVIAEQAAVMEENLEQLYDDQFIETCAKWAVPYIGDLIGCRQLYTSIPQAARSRAEVANTIAYRRRKGTACVLEQLARDVTGWNARAVEFFQALATTQYMNHIRPHNWCAPNLRHWEPLERINTAFDTVSRTVDVRSPGLQNGKHNIPNIGIYLWRLTAYPITQSPAPTLDGRRFFFSSLGNNIPLFTRPMSEKAITHIAEPLNVPEQISRNVLDEYLDDYYGSNLNSEQRRSLCLWLDGETVPSDQIRVCNLEDHLGSWAHLPETKIAIDPQLGRVALPENLAAVNNRQSIKISGFINGTYALDIGGEISNLISSLSVAEIETALQFNPQIGPNNIAVSGTVTADEITIELEFIGSLNGQEVPAIDVDVSNLTGDPQVSVTQLQSAQAGSNLAVDYHYGFSADMGGGEYERAVGFTDHQLPDQSIVNGQDIQSSLDVVSHSGGSVQIEDSGRYVQSLALFAEAGKHIELRSANRRRASIVAKEKIKISGGSQSSISLNGLLIAGAPLVLPETENVLQKLILRDCTLVPGRELTVEGEPKHPASPSLIIDIPNLDVHIERCILGPIHVKDQASVTISNSIIDANSESGIAYANHKNDGAGAELELVNSTIIGKVHTQNLKLASNVIFKSSLGELEESWSAPVISEQRQNGCVRFSYIPPGSRVPRRYRCQPDLAINHDLEKVIKDNANLSITDKQKIAEHAQLRVKPVFTSTRYGTPPYYQLSLICPHEISRGADDEAEMGAFHDLYQPQREINLKLRLDEYLRLGLKAGIFYAN